MANDETVKALPEACSNEAAAVEFIERQRWGNEPSCPRCGSLRGDRMRVKPKRAKKVPGPKPGKVTIEGDWGEALGRAIRKPKPSGGWPKPPKRRKPPQ